MRSRYKFFRKNCKASHEEALRTANIRKGYWAFSQNKWVQTWVSVRLLRNAGYTFAMDVYQKVHAAI